jgi:hypothetical protein
MPSSPAENVREYGLGCDRLTAGGKIAEWQDSYQVA